MSKKYPEIKKAAKTLGNWLDRAAGWLDSDDPLMILPYRGYANTERFLLKGRILENEGLFEGKSESELRNIIDSLKRFETDEMPDARVRLEVNGRTFDTLSDEEGYFIFDLPWIAPPKEEENRWLNAKLTLPDYPDEKGEPIEATGEIYLPSFHADYGVITDIDDTVLQTHVTSRFRLRMLYATLAQSADQRLPMEGVVELFQAFVKGGDGKRENPIFYVSSSPWNIYDLLIKFMKVQGLPKGPVLLRDYGIQPSGAFSDHKLKTISHVLETYPSLPFIMLGDTAHRDADFYIELSDRFPDRIKAVYIRQTRDTKNARRVARLIEKNSHIDVVLVHSSAEIIAHAKEKGLLKR